MFDVEMRAHGGGRSGWDDVRCVAAWPGLMKLMQERRRVQMSRRDGCALRAAART